MSAKDEVIIVFACGIAGKIHGVVGEAEFELGDVLILSIKSWSRGDRLIECC